MKSISHGHFGGSNPQRDVKSPFLLNPAKCRRPQTYRSHAAREYAYLLEVDPGVVGWQCSSLVLSNGGETHQPDFIVDEANGGSCLVSISSARLAAPSWIGAEAARLGFLHRTEFLEDFAKGFRLRNARELARYACHRCSLGDRIRLLAALDDLGSLTVAESLSAFHEGRAVAGLASLFLGGFIEMDIDTSLIGPETQVRRIRDRA